MPSPRPATDFDYKRYLASREWAVLKEQVRERSRGHCEHCLVGSYEDTHHVTYARIGHEELSDLAAVCRPCHEFLSGKSDRNPLDETWIYTGAQTEKAGGWCYHLVFGKHRGLCIQTCTDKVVFGECLHCKYSPLSLIKFYLEMISR